MSDIYINRGTTSYVPHIYPSGESFVFGPGGTPNLYKTQDCLFKRKEYDASDLVKIESNVKRMPGDISIDDYQFWAQDSWKEQHGTFAAAERFSEKLIEEHEEFIIAAYAYVRDKSSSQDALQKELLSEAGDVLWCANGIVSNASGSVVTGMQTYLYQAAMGTVVYNSSSNSVRHPVWREQAISVATNNLSPVRFSDIDALASGGFMSQPSPVMNIEDSDEVETNPIDVIRWFERASCMDAAALRVSAQKQYNYGEDPADNNFGTYYSAESYMAITRTIEQLAGKMTLDVAFVLKNLANVSISEAVGLNFHKIQSRVAANRIDHADGDRTDDLL